MPMRRLLSLLTLALAVSALAQQAAVSDPLAPLDFLLGTWSAKTGAAGSAGAQLTGTYTFRRDLAGHVLSRTSSSDTCKAPQSFDCQHNDQLTIFADPGSQAAQRGTLSALYLDSEGHVIHYTITTPRPHTVVFTSQSAPGTPNFQLIYRLEGNGPTAVMSGKFQGAAPGSADLHSYLEWSGAKQ